MALGTASLGLAAASAGTAAEVVTPAVAAADAAATVGGVSTLATVGSSLPSLATAATIGSSAVSALGSIAQSRASAASAGFNAKVAAQNAEEQTRNSQFAGAEGEQNVATQGAKTKAQIGATLANEGASGVDVNSGSAVDVRESEAKLGMLNALTIRSNAAKQAYGFQTQAASQNSQSQLLRSQQQSDTTGGYINAGATVLGGLGSSAKYTNWLSNNGLN